jgi:hypothetical protein
MVPIFILQISRINLENYFVPFFREFINELIEHLIDPSLKVTGFRLFLGQVFDFFKEYSESQLFAVRMSIDACTVFFGANVRTCMSASRVCTNVQGRFFRNAGLLLSLLNL